MKIKTITKNEIESVEYLRDLPGNGYKKAIEGYCRTSQLTKDFVREFKEDISKENFSLSPKLTYDLIENFPDLFDLEIWKTSKNKSLEVFKSKKFRTQFTTEELNNFFLEGNPYELSEEIFNEIFPYATTETKRTLLSIYKGTLTKEFLLKNSDVLSANTYKNQSIIKSLDKEDLETLLKRNKSLDMHTFINILCSRNDFGWHKRLCTEALDEKIHLVESGGTYNDDLKYAVSIMHEEVLLKLFKLLNLYNKNAISYSVLEYLLKIKDPSEDLCLVLIENFKSNNLVQALGNYAKEKGYETILIGLFL